MTGSGKELVPVGPRPVGAPKGSGSKYTEEIADEIIERLMLGETLIEIVNTTRDGQYRVKPGPWPSYGLVYDWCEPTCGSFQPSFAERFARARLIQQRYWLEECQVIANTPELGVEEVAEHSSKNGVTIKRTRKDMLGHRALKIDTRLKVIQRMNPQVWSERLQQLGVAPEPGPGEPGGQRAIINGGLPPDGSQVPKDEPDA